MKQKSHILEDTKPTTDEIPQERNNNLSKRDAGRPKKYTKADLPNKICAVCERPFNWRKKWERCWDEVRYCSDRCRGNRTKKTP